MRYPADDSQRRVRGIHAHLAPRRVAGTPAAGEAVKAKEYRYHFDLNAPGKLHPQARTGLLDFYDQLVDRTAEQAYNIADHLPVSRRQRHGLLS